MPIKIAGDRDEVDAAGPDTQDRTELPLLGDGVRSQVADLDLSGLLHRIGDQVVVATAARSRIQQCKCGNHGGQRQRHQQPDHGLPPGRTRRAHHIGPKKLLSTTACWLPSRDWITKRSVCRPRMPPGASTTIGCDTTAPAPAAMALASVSMWMPAGAPSRVTR